MSEIKKTLKTRQDIVNCAKLLKTLSSWKIFLFFVFVFVFVFMCAFVMVNMCQGADNIINFPQYNRLGF